MQEFWIPRDYIPTKDRPDTTNLCIKIHLPNHCQHCSKELKVIITGTADLSGIMNFNTCGHFIWWEGLWNNRITNLPDSLEKVAAIKVINDFDDGCKCNKCGLWYSMAAPNQLDNTFKCYTCRNRGW
jgi:hypothetical protein